jgi:REP element-mobilizing transposase RayT
MTDAELMAEERLATRWASYDYSSSGAYFVTLCVKGRKPVFGTVSDGQMVRSEAGEIASRCLLEIPKHFPNVTVDANVVMPDHVHAILMIETSDPPSLGGQDGERQRTRPLETLPLAVGSYKSSVTRLVHGIGDSAFQWQKSYHDRIIRDWAAYDNIRAYIVNNPRRLWESTREIQP